MVIARTGAGTLARFTDGRFRVSHAQQPRFSRLRVERFCASGRKDPFSDTGFGLTSGPWRPVTRSAAGPMAGHGRCALGARRPAAVSWQSSGSLRFPRPCGPRGARLAERALPWGGPSLERPARTSARPERQAQHRAERGGPCRGTARAMQQACQRADRTGVRNPAPGSIWQGGPPPFRLSTPPGFLPSRTANPRPTGFCETRNSSP